MTEIVRAAAGDIETLVTLGQAMHAESRYRCVPYSPAKVQAFLEALIAGRGAAFLAHQDGRAVGGIVAMLTSPWFSEARTACDLALYVEPSARGGGAGRKLVNALIDWAEGEGVEYLEIAVSSGVEPARASAMLERLGGAFVGGIFVWQKEPEA